MKSILRRTVTIGLTASALLGTFFVSATRVLALSEEQIVKILDQVPVFFIGNNQGVLLTADQPNNKKGPKVALAFVSPKDAQTYLDQVKKANPNIGNQGQIIVQPLSAIYVHNKGNKDKQDSFVFECCIPAQKNVEAAITLMKQNGQKVEQLRSTPLFVARFKGQKGYLVAREGDKVVDWPVFFSKDDLAAALETLKKQDPSLANNVEIEVLDLASLMATLTSKNEPSFSAIRLVPPKDAIEYVVTNVQNNQVQPQAPKK